MRFREVRHKEVEEIKETNTREKGLNGVASKLDVIEGRVSGYQNIKPEGLFTEEEMDAFWNDLFKNGPFAEEEE